MSWLGWYFCLFQGETKTCLRSANIGREQRNESSTMSDSAPLIPWQHVEFCSIEPVTNQDLDVHNFPTKDGGGGRSRTKLIQTSNSLQYYTAEEMKFDQKRGLQPYWESIWCLEQWLMKAYKLHWGKDSCNIMSGYGTKFNLQIVNGIAFTMLQTLMA